MEKEKFRSALEQGLKNKVLLTVHDNTNVFLNATFQKKCWRIRLHWMFLKGALSIAKQIAHYISTHNRESSKIIDRYIEKHWHWVRHPLPPIRTEGKFFDLQEIFNRLNRIFLKGKVKAKITWGTSSRRAYEQMQMGSYSSSRKLITIHPHLDRKFVPPFVVEATVFHEMCHALVPIEEKNGRKQIHPPAFKKMEGRYPHLEKAKRWEDKNLNRLLKRGGG